MSDPTRFNNKQTCPDLRRLDLSTRLFPRRKPNGKRLDTMSIDDLAMEARCQPHPQQRLYREELWHRLKPRVQDAIRYRFRNLLVQAKLEAADFLSESFLVLDEALLHFDSSKGRGFWPYYLTGLIHHLIDLARMRSRIQETSLETEPPRPSMESLEVELLTEQAQLDLLLPTDISNRDLKLIVFRLYHFEGMTIADLATMHGRSIGTIHNWLKEVQERLQQVHRITGDRPYICGL